MTTPALKSANRKFIHIAWLILMVGILSCGVLAKVPSTQIVQATMTLVPTNVAVTSTPPPATFTPDVTPTLGCHSIWRQSRIVFVSNRSGNFQIYLMKPDGSEMKQLSDSKGDNLAPAWSQDAKHIAFVSTRDGNNEIYVMSPDGTNQVNITHSSSNDHSPIWVAKDKIAFVSDRSGRERVFIMNIDGTNIQSFQYTSIDSVEQFYCLTWLGEGLISFTVESGNDRKVKIVDIATGNTSTLNELNSGYDHSCPLLPALVK